ncbi:MAG: NUDIX domain-containing protein [Actinobacteria bacterium]|nr:NUDIX domain-containing protein [Actinomycetota bacterium]
MATKHSAGILLFRRDGGPGVELLLAHPGGPFWKRRDEGAWSIPKGEIEPGEEPVAAALRELGEELGPAPELQPEQLIELGAVRQRAGKVVEAWAAEADFDPTKLVSVEFEMEWPPRSGTQASYPEVDRAEWFDPEAARVKILAGQAPLIDRLLEHLDAAAESAA